MNEIPTELKYTKEHEWIKVIDEQQGIIGITYFAQESLGDITFVELPKVGDKLNKGNIFGTVESVKAASDLYMPVTGTILEVNETIDDTPELVNASPFEEGWMIKVKIENPHEINDLLTSEDYEQFVETQN